MVGRKDVPSSSQKRKPMEIFVLKVCLGPRFCRDSHVKFVWGLRFRGDFVVKFVWVLAFVGIFM